MVDSNKYGIISTVIITILAVGFVFSNLTTTPDSIQNQGEKVIENTVEDVLEVPAKVETLTQKSINMVKEIPENLPDTFPETVEKIKEIPPELPPVVEKALNDEKISVEVSIQPGASISECEDSLTCLSPYYVIIYKDGNVSWINNDIATHSIMSGNPEDGPNGLFDSGLIPPYETFTQVFGIIGEYEYFCIVHPWVQGKIFVEGT